MIGSRFSRLRAILLLAAFGLSLAGQALAATVIADQGSSAASKPAMIMDGAGGASNCPNCDQANNTAMVPNCAVGFCWGLVAVPAQALPVEPMKSVIFAPLPDTFPHGLAVRPEPHPPRSSASI